MDSLETAIEILANQITQHNFCIDQILEQYESLVIYFHNTTTINFSFQ